MQVQNCKEWRACVPEGRCVVILRSGLVKIECDSRPYSSWFRLFEVLFFASQSGLRKANRRTEEAMHGGRRATEDYYGLSFSHQKRIQKRGRKKKAKKRPQGRHFIDFVEIVSEPMAI